MLVQRTQAGQDATENHPDGGRGQSEAQCKIVVVMPDVSMEERELVEEEEEAHSPETADHAGQHHVQDDKLPPFHLPPGESEADICLGPTENTDKAVTLTENADSCTIYVFFKGYRKAVLQRFMVQPSSLMAPSTLRQNHSRKG